MRFSIMALVSPVNPVSESGRILAAMNRAWLWVLLVTGCGGACPAATSASSEATPTEAPTATTGDAPEGDPSELAAEKPTASAKDAKPSETESKPASEVSADPAFPENASVAEAMALVPKGTQRSNIDPETLGTPLSSEALYEPCKVGAQHFKLRVAVWNGHAVGVDVTTPNKALASCIDKRVRSIEWHDKVRSLNNVDYSM
jgi:hypothetical protein